MERPLRLVTANPLDQLARTLEALLVVASAPLPVGELVAAADDDRERVEMALRLLSERYREGRSGIVLEQVAGGWAFRASRDAAEACGRLFERPVQRGLSQAGLETLERRDFVALAGAGAEREHKRAQKQQHQQVAAAPVPCAIGSIAISGRIPAEDAAAPRLPPDHFPAFRRIALLAKLHIG